MATKAFHLLKLGDLVNGQEADFFALLTNKELLTTRDNKPYYKVTFRDAAREVGFPLWADSAFFADCRDKWHAGEHFKLRATFRETNYGPQLDIQKIRTVAPADHDEGFDPCMCLPRSRFSSETMFAEMCELVVERITEEPLRGLVLAIMRTHRETLLTLPAATKNHHAYVGGYLEHVLSVTRTAVYLADKYDDYYPDLRLRKDIVVAGAVLHDIGKLREIELLATGAHYTPAGTLLGHMVQGRDIVREALADHPLNPETLLRLEHVIVAHQRLPEWGSPKPPMTPEAYIVHYSDDLDAKMNMLHTVLTDPLEPGPITSKKNQLYQQVYKGENRD